MLFKCCCCKDDANWDGGHLKGDLFAQKEPIGITWSLSQIGGVDFVARQDDVGGRRLLLPLPQLLQCLERRVRTANKYKNN